MIPPSGTHPPGSFTKNFAWHGKGLLGLHEGIRSGFSGGLVNTTRTEFRETTSLNSDRFILTANFWLYNVVKGGVNVIPVDELVRQAVQEPHSTAFDRLALFTLNLSLGGERKGRGVGVPFPAPWANAYVKQELWNAGRWQSSALSEDAVQAFIYPFIEGEDVSKRKCLTNYRGIYEQAKFIPVKQPEIFTDAEGWIAGAMFTAWDRRALIAGGGSSNVTPANLVSVSEDAEDYKLLGLSLDEFRVMAAPIADAYVSAGGLARFTAKPVTLPAVIAKPAAPAKTGAPATPSTPPAKPPEPVAEDLRLPLETGTDTAVEREIIQRLVQKRDRKLAWTIKKLYGHECMACGKTVVIGLDPERRYSEAAHIKPLGNPHDGPDKAGNLLVLCPNHHLQLDRGVISLEWVGGKARFLSCIPGDNIHKKDVTLRPSHVLDEACVRWHQASYVTVGG